MGGLFIKNLLDIEPKLKQLMDRELPMKLSDDDKNVIANSKICSYCRKEILGGGVRDHGNVNNIMI